MRRTGVAVPSSYQAWESLTLERVPSTCYPPLGGPLGADIRRMPPRGVMSAEEGCQAAGPIPASFLCRFLQATESNQYEPGRSLWKDF